MSPRRSRSRSAAPPERFELAPGYRVPRVIVGLWQLSAGHAPSPFDPDRVLDDLEMFVDAGLDTFDCADIYVGVEDLLGQLRRRLPGRRLQVHTKCVPDLASLPTLNRGDVEAIIDRSLLRLDVERLDLVQYCWWDYAVPGCVEAAGWLADLRGAGKIRHLAATNLDRTRVQAIADAGIELVSHQVQYSLLDRRPANALADLAIENGRKLLCYGSLAGGFLTDAWAGDDDPSLHANRSLAKYRLIIEDFGGWSAYQSLLRAAREVAARHDATTAQVAARWVLDRPAVGAVILGASSAEHLADTLRIGQLHLDDQDHAILDTVLARHRGPTGDVFGLERVKGGPHAGIMWTDLNRRGGGLG